MPGKYKLIYFAFPGRGEVIRLLLHAGKQEFEDHRVPKEEWGKLRSTIPGGALPILETPETKPGHPMTQSSAIARYLAMKFKLYPVGDELKIFQAERAVEVCKDILSALDSFVGAPDEKKTAAAKAYMDGRLGVHIGELQRFAEETGGPFFTGKDVSFADLYLVSLVPSMQILLGVDVREKFPFVKTHFDAVKAKLPEAAKHMAP